MLRLPYPVYASRSSPVQLATAICANSLNRKNFSLNFSLSNSRFISCRFDSRHFLRTARKVDVSLLLQMPGHICSFGKIHKIRPIFCHFPPGVTLRVWFCVRFRYDWNQFETTPETIISPRVFPLFLLFPLLPAKKEAICYKPPPKTVSDLLRSPCYTTPAIKSFQFPESSLPC